MVRPIIVESEGRIFYGAREAWYLLPLRTKKNLDIFSGKLIATINNINEGFSDPMRGLYLQQFPHRERIKLEKDELTSCLESTGNIFLLAGTSKKLIVNFISNFVPDKDNHKNRIMEIKRFGIPNDVIEYNPTLLYKLGESYNSPHGGEDFDISISNYRRIEK